jgi:hypothetical protein
MPRQQLKDQLQTQHSLDTGNYIKDKHKIQASTGGRKNKYITIIIIIITIRVNCINSFRIFSLRVKKQTIIKTLRN